MRVTGGAFVRLLAILPLAGIGIPSASALGPVALGTDGYLAQEADLGVCASLEWPNGARLVGSYSAHGVVTGPGIKAATVREVTPIDVTDPSDPAELPGVLTGLCTNGVYEGATAGVVTYTVAGHFTGPASSGEIALHNVCTVSSGTVTCQDSTAQPGPENETEIVDPCGDPPSDEVASYADICTGSFRGLWEPVLSDDGSTTETWQLEGLEVQLRLLGAVPERPQSVQYAMRWDVGGCRHRWVFNSGLDTPSWTGDFAELCAGGSNGYQVSIPPEHISVQSDRITIRLLSDEELAPIADKLVLGQKLSEPSASTFLRLATSDPQHEGLVGWDSTSEGRPFVIGQDRPADPN